ncbi:MAG: flagellar P-ring protein FlgI [Pirellulaceae bacterium]|nr:MAG: flagellar P-ring protein FlgI [Pirellulaceae bacterium]
METANKVRKNWRAAWILTALFFVSSSLTGCTGLAFLRGSATSEDDRAKREEIRAKLTSSTRPRVLSEIGAPAMLTLARLQNVGLVTQLNGTGGAVEPGSLRERILAAMRRNEVEKPNALLDHASTALVAVKAAVPPGSQKGDLLDLTVTVPPVATASDLAGGWLLETPLMEMRSLEGQVRESFEHMRAEGRIVTYAQITGQETEEAKRTGRILGGGRLEESRNLGIVIETEYADALTMAAVLPAINKRFTYFNGHAYKGVATPRQDSYIEVAIPDKYRRDPYHFINTVLHVGINETAEDRAARLQRLRKEVLEPITTRRACWELEAIGDEAVGVLTEALKSSDPEVRFYAAHSLAYLNQRAAVPVLVSLCRAEPAFRAMCLNGLLVIDHYEAADALEELLHAADPEVRYGALLALREEDAPPAGLDGEMVEGAGRVVEIPSPGPPLVVVSLTKRPEVVFFGAVPTVHIDAFHYVTPQILIAPSELGKLRVSRFQPGEPDRVEVVPADLRSLLIAIAKVGGRYGDWVKFLREANREGYFAEPLAMNPVPTTGRVYNRGKSVGVAHRDTELPASITDPFTGGAASPESIPRPPAASPPGLVPAESLLP